MTKLLQKPIRKNHWTLVLFTTVLVALSNWSPANSTEVDYWVKADVGDSECPLGTPVQQCVTITDLINSSSLHGSINIHFLPGLHIPQLSGLIKVGNEEVSSYETSSIKILGECNTVECEIMAIIKCFSHKIGFALCSPHQLELANITIVNCGYEISPVISNSGHTLSSRFHIASLFIINARLASINDMTISNSSGFGLLVVARSSELYLQLVATTVTQSNTDPKFNATYGGNVYILLQFKRNRNVLHRVKVTDCTFSYGMGSACGDSGTQCTSGGLAVQIIQRVNFFLFFNNSVFSNNVGFKGAGLYIAKVGRLDLYKGVVIRNCYFINNSGLQGAAVYLEKESALETLSDYLYLIRVQDSIFRDNTVTDSGGGIFLHMKADIPNSSQYRSTYFISNNLLQITDSTFINNRAMRDGGAINLYMETTAESKDFNGCHQLFLENNSFTHNRAKNGAALNAHFIPRFISNWQDSFKILTFSYLIRMKISDTNFNSNLASMEGGAINFVNRASYYHVDQTRLVGIPIHSELQILQCNLNHNSAYKGSAIAISVPYSTFMHELAFPVTLIELTTSNISHNTQTGHEPGDDVGGSTVYLQNIHGLVVEGVLITNNNCRAFHIVMSHLTIKGKVLIENNTVLSSHGAGMYFECRLISTSYSGAPLTFSHASQLHLISNHAEGYGGGIAVKGGCKSRTNCFYGYILKENQEFKIPNITLRDNTAGIAGNSIYGGNLNNCNYIQSLDFWNTFNIVERYTSSAVSSLPYKVCICTTNFPVEHNCLHRSDIATFAGKSFTIPVVGVGVYNYSSPTILTAHLVTNFSAHLDELRITQGVGLECKNVSYVVYSAVSNVTMQLFLTISNSDLEYSVRPQTVVSTIDIFIKDCPYGFESNSESGSCTCTSHLLRAGITCNIENQTISRTPDMWIGNFSNEFVVHDKCPFGYCNSYMLAVDPYNQQEQCSFNRSGVLCGACRPGLSLALGTSQCKQCSNIYLLLLVPFTLAGMALVVLLLKCNLTVSTGTINGLIFYANVIQANRTAFFPAGLNSIPTYMLSIFIAWLNLDFGKEICFTESLNAYTRTWLQFVFPLYIWLIVGLLILISRYSITVSKLTGSNTVSVLATLFLLSYTKLLRTVFDSFMSTSIQSSNDTLTNTWLIDGNYLFLEWPHIALFLFALLVLILHIIPFTLLVLTSPVLQKYSNFRCLHWVNRINPLIDSFQGPYKRNFRFWTGLLLLTRLVMVLVNSANITADFSVNLFVTIIVASILLLIWVITGSIYRKTLPNYIELFFLFNLLLYAVSCLFLRAEVIHPTQSEHYHNIVVLCMVGSVFIIFLCIVAFHIYSILTETRCWRKVLKKFQKRPRIASTNSGNHLEECAAAIGFREPKLPTCTTVDLNELLLDSTET